MDKHLFAEFHVSGFLPLSNRGPGYFFGLDLFQHSGPRPLVVRSPFIQATTLDPPTGRYDIYVIEDTRV